MDASCKYHIEVFSFYLVSVHFWLSRMCTMCLLWLLYLLRWSECVSRLLTLCRYSAWNCRAYWQPVEPQPCRASVETAGWHDSWCHWSQWNWQRLCTRSLLVFVTRNPYITIHWFFQTQPQNPLLFSPRLARFPILLEFVRFVNFVIIIIMIIVICYCSRHVRVQSGCSFRQ